MFGGIAIAAARARVQREAASSSVTSSMDGLSGNLPGSYNLPAQDTTIPMSESYNSAASRPVFNERAQSRAKSIFGDNGQRQASVKKCCEG